LLEIARHQTPGHKRQLKLQQTCRIATRGSPLELCQCALTISGGQQTLRLFDSSHPNKMRTVRFAGNKKRPGRESRPRVGSYALVLELRGNARVEEAADGIEESRIGTEA
jgi:hypothetical protein